MPPTRSLDAHEMRVLGALLEKQQTTPDQYPLSINTLIAACNQKSNREPVTTLSETQVVEALDRLRFDALTWRTEGARAERWQQNVDRRWHLTAPKKALITLLLLRGPQTPGELKSRSERMHDFASVDEVDATLRQMAEGDEDALVRELPRRPGQRENRWIHLFATAEAQREIEASLDRAHSYELPPDAASPERGPGTQERLAALERQVAELRQELADLRQKLAGLLE